MRNMSRLDQQWLLCRIHVWKTLIIVGKTVGNVCRKGMGLWVGVGKRTRVPESNYMYYILGECMYV
jgi:hypothetical protein